MDKTKQRRTIRVEKLPDSQSSSREVKHAKTTDAVKTSQIFYYEEEEAGRRDANKDLELHHSVCEELCRTMNRIKELKADQSSGSKAELEDLQMHGALQFISLKKLNRIAHFRSKKVRHATSDAKLKIDQHHLKLQNLLYEVAHLEKEMSKCLQFKSKHEEISLVPVEQFYDEASEDISKPDVTRNNPHELTLARLHWELEQRKRLSLKLKEAAGLKNQIMSNVQLKRDNLDSLQPKLTSVMQATKPVQEHLGMLFDQKRQQYRTALYLPSPLYVLYVQATAYAEACDKHLSVSIQGDVDVARAMEQTTTVTQEENDVDDVEEQEKTAEVRRHRTTSVHDRTHNLLRKHPLSITMAISNSRDKSQLTLTVYFLPSLNFATASVTLVPHETATTISGGDLLLPDNLLSCLYPGDDGTVSPNPANTYLPTGDEWTKNLEVTGRPYRWVQWLCGLQFLEDDPSKVSVPLSRSYMADTVQRLRARVHDRLSLQKQLAAFEQGIIPVPAESMSLYPAKISSRLSQWKRSTFQDFTACVHTERLVEADLAKPTDMYFTASVQRGTATMSVHVVIGHDYPTSIPLLALSIHWAGIVHTALNDEAVRDMEAEVNVHTVNGNGTHSDTRIVLTQQLQHLLVCLDVYLETFEPKPLTNAKEFARERICSRLARGRSRARPYKYISQLCFFTQR